jgi:hypothetical protein
VIVPSGTTLQRSRALPAFGARGGAEQFELLQSIRPETSALELHYHELRDPAITAWAAKHTLHLYTTYRDEEVRSVELVGSDGRKCQLWIDAPDQSGNVQVHAWDYKKRREDCKGTVADLPRCLDQAYATAMKWLG